MKSFITSILFLIILFSGVVYSQQTPKSAFVVNSVANTLSVVNLENHTVIEDTLSPGQGSNPNHLVLRNGRGYVVNSGINDIMVFDIPTLKEVSRIALPNGSNPWAMEFINDSLAAVSYFLTDSVALVNVKSGKIIKTVRVGISPEGLKFHNGKLYVANTGFVAFGVPYEVGKVSVIDPVTFTVVDSIRVGINPQNFDVDSKGNLLVACTGDYSSIMGEIDIIDATADTIISKLQTNVFVKSVSVNSADKGYLAVLTPSFQAGVIVYDFNQNDFEKDESQMLPGGEIVNFDSEDNAYLLDPGDWASTGILRVFSPEHQELHSYPVNIGPIYVSIYEPEASAISGLNQPVPEDFILLQNYPNPFNPSTNIAFYLPMSQQVSLEIFNVLGQKIRTLFSGFLPAGSHNYRWNGRNDQGKKVPAGVYFYRLQSSEKEMTKKMQLMN